MKNGIGPEIQRRCSIRLKTFDYSLPGMYFVTVCVQNRECLLGDISGPDMRLNESGSMVKGVWHGLPERFPNLDLDAFVVMPNHIHGILTLGSMDDEQGGSKCRQEANTRFAPTVPTQYTDDGRGEPCVRPEISSQNDFQKHQQTCGVWGDQGKRGDHPDYRVVSKPAGTLIGTVGRIIQAFKSISTHQYINGVKKTGWPPFQDRLWQRNYYEHVIRNDVELNRIREYIHGNPSQWNSDDLFVETKTHSS
jgi:REP element-mobilizing transposase RayT